MRTIAQDFRNIWLSIHLLITTSPPQVTVFPIVVGHRRVTLYHAHVPHLAGSPGVTVVVEAEEDSSAYFLLTRLGSNR